MAIGEGAMMKAIPAVIMTLALAACTSTSSAPPPAAGESSPSFGQKVENLLLLGTTNPQPAAAGEQDKERVFCPELAIQPGTAVFQLYEPGHENDPFSQRYQARFSRLARECDVQNHLVTVKIGFAGRAVVGPKGNSGQSLTLPVRIALLDNADKPVFSRLEQVDVAIPPGSGGADFTRIITTEAMPLPPDRMAGWRLRIGFDTGTKAKPAPGRHRSRGRRRG